jgi:hypothetical protein
VKDATDPETGEPVKRIWKVTFGAEYGRPTPKDDDVFVALLKVSQAQGLMEKVETTCEPRAFFTSRELIRILGWDDCGKSYKAIDDALNRIHNTRITATNYWYDNHSKLWVDRKFGIIDDVKLYERSKYDRAKRRAREMGEPNPQSWIRWSDVMLESFQSGYVRQLDIEVYRSLSNPVARKLFRYLGKHFWKKSEHKIDVRDLCYEKLGYPKYDNDTCKRKLQKPLAELEELGLFGLSHQFEQSYGKCHIVFRKEPRKSEKKQVVRSPLETRLRSLGVFEADARAAVKRHSEERILTDIEDVEFRAKQGQVRSSKAGLLSKLLKEEQPARPEGFLSSAERKQREIAKAERAAAEERAEQEAREREAEQASRTRKRLREFLAAMASENEREEFAAAAFANNSIYRRLYRDSLREGDSERANEHRENAMLEWWQKQSRELGNVRG